MAKFDQALWAEMAPRFREIRGEQPIERFLAVHDLSGLKWHQLEQGRSGMTVESLVSLCRKCDVSPTWLLLGNLPKRWTSLEPIFNRDEAVKRIIKTMRSIPDTEMRRFTNKKLHDLAELIATHAYQL